MITIYVGVKNDATVYADEYFTAISKEDLAFMSPTYEIKCDGGVYPGITDFEEYICTKAMKQEGIEIY